MLTNPLDELFNTEPTPPSQVVQYEQITEGALAELAPAPEKDAEDVEIDGKIDTVYTAALDAYNNQTAYCDIIEPRYAARNAEVAAQYLNIALNAAATRARVKGDRKRSEQFVPYTGKTQNNVIVASREDVMKFLTIDAEVKEIK
jgi:hypothetical protein